MNYHQQVENKHGLKLSIQLHINVPLTLVKIYSSICIQHPLEQAHQTLSNSFLHINQGGSISHIDKAKKLFNHHNASRKLTLLVGIPKSREHKAFQSRTG